MDERPVRNLKFEIGSDENVNVAGVPQGRRSKKRMSKRTKIIIRVILGIFLVIVLYVLFLIFSVQSMFNDVHAPLDTINMRGAGQEVDLGEEPFSTLILGIDREGPHDRGRSDTMMLVTVNPNLGTTYILSLARDTMVTIDGRQTRINHAYAYGGPTLAIDTVQQLLNVSVDRYVEIDMLGFGPLIDAAGGITVYNNTVAFSEGGYHFPLGEIRLTGSSALVFVRMRYQDPQGDFGRQERQRAVTEAMMRQMTSSAVTNHNAILSAAGDSMQTDISFGDMTTIALNYAGALGHVENLELRGQGQMINGMSLIVVAEADRLEMSTRLRNHLEMD